jgi:hypothetical protein
VRLTVLLQEKMIMFMMEFVTVKLHAKKVNSGDLMNKDALVIAIIQEKP